MQPAAAALARATGRPVKVTLSREQDFEMIRSRHPGKVWMKTGAAADGTLLAREVRIVLDAGAYADDSPGVAGIAALFCRGPYRIENVSIESRPVYTNKLRSGAFRGFGGPQVAIAGETQIDEIADRLGMDPIDLRLKNVVRPGEEWMIGVALNKAGLSSAWSGSAPLAAGTRSARRCRTGRAASAESGSPASRISRAC